MKWIVVISLTLFADGALSAAIGVGELPDPTRPLGGRVVAAPVRIPVQAPPNILQSILVSPQRRQAVISGRTVGIGDRVGDAQVIEILPYEVVLQRGGQEVRMRLMARLNKQVIDSFKEP